jgi:hypothetical protein
MGYASESGASARERFLADYAARTGEVREIFRRVFHVPAGTEPGW